MKALRFSEYLDLKEWANYGFSSLQPVDKKKISNDDPPINPINCETIMQELINMGPLGIYEPNHLWQDVLEWGNNIGAIKIDVSPLGSYKIIVRRKIKDIQGEDTWVCKQILSLTENEHNENEVALANNIREEIEKLSMEMIDSPKRGKFEDFNHLVDQMASTVRQHYPSYCMFPKGVHKVTEDYYKIYFEFKGHGVESPSGRVEQFDIDILWDKKKGLIRCWGYDVSSPMSHHTWTPMPSEWDEWFAPSQPLEEIIECVKKAFMTY